MLRNWKLMEAALAEGGEAAVVAVVEPDVVPAIVTERSGPAIGQVFRRMCDACIHEMQGEPDEIEVSFSSEFPVEREFGREVLLHGPDNVDLSLLESGPFLLGHQLDVQMGACFQTRIVNKRGRCVIRFSECDKAQVIKRDMLKGIRPRISVGYRILAVTQKVENGITVFYVTRWQPYEVSSVAIPADFTVGVGRSATDRPAIETAVDPTPFTKDTPEPTTEAPMPITRRLLEALPTEGGGSTVVTDVNAVRQSTITDERKRIADIATLCRQHGATELEPIAIRDGMSIADVKDQILTKVYKAKELDTTRLDPNLGMSNKDKKRYSFTRALSLRAAGKDVDGIEGEMSVAVAKRSGRAPEGFFVPPDVLLQQLNQRALTAMVNTDGGYTIGDQLLTGQMVELLRNKTQVQALGARTMAGLHGNVLIPKVTGGSTAYWLPENGDVTLSQQVFGQLSMTPKRLAAATAYSKQLLAQSDISVDSFIRDDINIVINLAKDLAAINGSGTAGQPRGILSYAASNNNADTDKRAADVTFGAAATWPKVIQFETNVANANADASNMAWLTTPSTRGKWKGISKVTSYPVFLWENDMVNGYRAVVSNQPNFVNTGGSLVAASTLDRVIFGNWSDLILGDWDGIDVVTDPYTLAGQNLVKIIVNIMTDVVLRQPKSFSVSTDSGAQ